MNFTDKKNYMKNRFIEYSPSQKWVRVFDEDNMEYLTNTLDFELLFYGGQDECMLLASQLQKDIYANNI